MTIDLSGTPDEELFAALGHLHRTTAVGARVEVALGPRSDRGRLADIARCAGFTDVVLRSSRLRATRARTLASTLGPALRLVVCGLNPSLYAADVGIGFARPGNRFWPAMLEAGLVERDRDPLAAYALGIGMTDLAKRATARADELTIEEYRDGLACLDRLCAWLAPRAICMVGLDGWRKVVDRKAVPGWQAAAVGGRPVYLMANTSGLNARVPVSEFARHLRAAVAPPPCDR